MIVGHNGDLDDLHALLEGWDRYFVRAWRLLDYESFLAESKVLVDSDLVHGARAHFHLNVVPVITRRLYVLPVAKSLDAVVHVV